MRQIRLPLVVLAVSLLIAQAQQASPAVTRTATAELRDAKGTVVGRATLTEAVPGPVLIKVTFERFMAAGAGEHGLHLHAVGQCTPTFAAAGGHFNPGGRQHGFLAESGHHAGDLPNVRVDGAGNAMYQVRTSLVTLGDGPRSVFDQDGTALVLHAGADDYHTDPAGASGDRIACGVVMRAP